MIEPYLTHDDLRWWDVWSRTWRLWGQSAVHLRRVRAARGYLNELLSRQHIHPYIGLSGGKDSVCVAHLASQVGICQVMSERDDLDYPGTEDVVQEVTTRLSLRLDILRPSVSLWDWLKGAGLPLDADIHGRLGTMSTEHFYGLIQGYRSQTGCNAAVLGLTSHESRARAMNRKTHGPVYQRKDGITICQPIVDWHPIDVYAYLMKYDLPIHPVYRCIGLNPGEPYRIRSGWPVHRTGEAHGHYIWLKRYWPSIFSRLESIWPNISLAA